MVLERIGYGVDKCSSVWSGHSNSADTLQVLTFDRLTSLISPGSLSSLSCKWARICLAFSLQE